MDSRQIVDRIEAEHPEPSVHLESPVLAKLEEIMTRIMPALRPVYFLTVPEVILGEASVEYWYRTRTEMAGMSLEKLGEERGGDKAWEKARPVIQEVEALLAEDKGGSSFWGRRRVMRILFGLGS